MGINYQTKIFFLSRSYLNHLIHHFPFQYNKIQLSLKKLYGYNEKLQNVIRVRSKINVAFCYGFNGYTVGNSVEPELKEKEKYCTHREISKSNIGVRYFFQYGHSLWNKYLRMSITDIHIIDCFSVKNNALLFSAILCTSINLSGGRS